MKFSKHALITAVLLILTIGGYAQLSLSRQTSPSTTSTSPASQASPTTSIINSDSPAVLGAQDTLSFDRKTLYQLINAYRAESGLNQLAVDPNLEQSSDRKIQDMIDNGYYRHEDSENRESWYLFEEVGYHFTRAGENLAFNVNTPWQVLNAWMKSPLHNKELLQPAYLDMGIATDCQLQTATISNCIVVLHLGRK